LSAFCGRRIGRKVTKTASILTNIVTSAPCARTRKATSSPVNQGFPTFSGRFGMQVASSMAKQDQDRTRNVRMFDSETRNYEENDMDLSNIDSANFDAMVAEEAILDWLVNLESDDTDYELAESDDLFEEPVRVAN